MEKTMRNQTDGGKKEREITSDVQEMMTIAKEKKNSTCGVGH